MKTKGKILIADDNIDIMKGLRYNFKKRGYESFGSYTIDDTIQLLKKERIDVAILDTCDMKGKEGLIKVLEFIEKESPTTQSIIFSVNADRYETQVKNFKVVRACICKPAEFKDIEKIVRECIPLPITIKINNKELAITDPFDVPFSLIGKLELEDYKKLYQMLDKRYGKQINQKFRETGARTLVVCKDDNGNLELAGKSNSPYYSSDDELKNMEEERGKICYVVGRDRIEEWTFIPQIPDNPYPTVPIYLGREDEEVEDIIKPERLIISDFDTGNPDILAFKDEYRQYLKISVEKWRRREIEYMDGTRGDYYYCKSKIKIGVCDSKDTQKFCCAEFEVLFVSDWGGSIFTKAQSPLRNAFVGRGLWLSDKLRFSLILNAKDEKNMFSSIEC